MSAAQTKAAQLNWIHVDDDLSYADVVLAPVSAGRDRLVMKYQRVLRVFCERVQTGWLISADASDCIKPSQIVNLMSVERVSAIYRCEDQLPEFLWEHGLAIVECA